MNTEPEYILPAATRIGHVHLKVARHSALPRFLLWIAGFEIMTMYGTDAAFISAGGYHHHIGLKRLVQQECTAGAQREVPVCFTLPILYPTRRDLAVIYSRLQNEGYPFTGASDHGVSEALYLDDPDENGG
jgi:catechol 2,3-dioxygenase